jgi:hypothetical protein
MSQVALRGSTCLTTYSLSVLDKTRDPLPPVQTVVWETFCKVNEFAWWGVEGEDICFGGSSQGGFFVARDIGDLHSSLPGFSETLIPLPVAFFLVVKNSLTFNCLNRQIRQLILIFSST